MWKKTIFKVPTVLFKTMITMINMQNHKKLKQLLIPNKL